MNRVTAPLHEGDKGDAVVDLQKALQMAVRRDAIRLDDIETRSVLLEKLTREIVAKAYSETTIELVRRFQEQDQLDPNGGVDDPTANALNTLLEQWGMLNGHGNSVRADVPDTSYTLQVTVLDGRQAPIPGLSVRAANTADNAPSASLGEPAVTGADGTVVLRFNRSAFVSGDDPDGRGLILGFAVSRQDVPLTAKVVSGGVSPTEKGISFVPALLTVTAHAVVTGQVTYDESLPAQRLEVQVRNLRFGGTRDPLGTVTTDATGAFALPYDPGTAAVNLEAVVTDSATPDGVVALGKITYAVELSHALTLTAPLPKAASEFYRLSADLAAQIGEPGEQIGKLGGLVHAVENAKRQDLTMLSRSTGWDPRLIALAAMSERLAAADNHLSLDSQTLYGMLRAGLPSDVETLVHVDETTVTQALTLARDNGILDFDDATIVDATQNFQKFAVSAKLAMKPSGSQASYGALMTSAGLVDDDHRADFAKLIFAHRGNSEKLWDGAKDLGLPVAQIDRLKLQGKFSLLAGNSAPLTNHLLSLDLSDPSALIEKGLFEAEAWKQELATASGQDDAALAALIPPSYASEKLEEPEKLKERVDAYANDLARKMRISYPTHVVTQQVDSGKLKVTAPAATVTLLKAATVDGFALGQTPPEVFFAAKGAGAHGLDDAGFAAAKEGVKELHRTYQLTPDSKSMTVLNTMGLTSAYDIAGMSEREFAWGFEDAYWKHWKIMPAEAVTKLVYRKAQQISSTTYTLFSAAKTLKAQAGIPVTAPTTAVKHAAQTNLLKHFPTMEGLFGSNDYIECPHCRSVLSPAAYFVDILQFIDPDEPMWANFLANWKGRHANLDYTNKFAKPIDVLRKRRPDLFAIELTCENTLTALPYIDVVNEILEYYVANGSLTEKAARDTGAATTQELLAEPQNLIQEAYTELLTKSHPDPLPFDLWIETIREFCNGFDTPLTQIMETFRESEKLFDDAQRYDRSDTFIEYLGFSPAEAAILANPKPLTEWWSLYGYPNAAEATTEAVDAETGQRIDLNSAKALSRRLGLSYQDLVDIVQTDFVNPELPNLGLLYKLGVSIRDARHYTDHRADPPPVTAEQKADRSEVDAFEAKLSALGDRAKEPLATMQGKVDALPYATVLVLADPNTSADFDLTTLRYADSTPADPLTFVRIAHFVRLWRRLGWTIEETDRALKAFVPQDAPFAEPTPGNGNGLAQRPLRSALIYLSHLAALTDRLQLPDRLRRRLATLWLDLPTTGRNSLYEQLFLTRSVLRSDPIFDHPLGRYLDWAGFAANDIPKLRDHLPSVQSALGLSSSDVSLILADARIDPAVNLDLPTLSMLHRYALLATMLKITVPDLVTLKVLSGKNPFATLERGALTTLEQDHPYADTLGFVGLAGLLDSSGLSVADLDVLLRNRHGKHPVDGLVPAEVLQQLKALADGVRAIRLEHAVPVDAGSLGDDQVRRELGLVLERDVLDKLFAMVQGTAEFAAITSDADKTANELEVRKGAKEFFDKFLRKETIDAATSFGFLTDADFDDLIKPLPPIPSGLNPDRELAARKAADEAVRAKRAILATAFLPFVQRRLIRQLTVSTITAQAGAEPAQVEDLLTDGRLLGMAAPLLDAFEHVDGTINTDLPGFKGFLEVPATGVYKFTSVIGRKDGNTKLSFDHLDNPVVLTGVAAAAQDEVSGKVELQAGRLYAFDYATTNLGGGTAHLDVQSAALSRGGVASLRLYPKDVVVQASAALALIRKVLGLVQTLGLSQAEVRHLATHPDTFRGLKLGDLPTTRVGDTQDERDAAVTRFTWVSRLLDYADFKRELGGGDELLSILEANESADPEKLTTKVYPIVAGLVGQSVGTVAHTATMLRPSGLADPDQPYFASVRDVKQLMDALRIVRALGVPAGAVVGWTGVIRESDQQKRFDIAAAVKDAIEATLETTAWQQIAKPIFDRLRARQRDALVAYAKQAVGVSTLEQLYEYFLIDPGMEPVVQTSRIRLATASVQLFIQRILLNLERECPADVVNAAQWEWMKRYRVWEANRKIFLYPENWLEPEFRDQKTHLFTELESTLLESDVSSDLAEDAFLTYLTKLDQLARLDIVASHLEDDPDPALRTLHVFGRTFGTPHAYYYRRYVRGGWTPWEPVGVDVQGDHLAPIVWHDRLRLFWVTFTTVAVESGAQSVTNGSYTILPAMRMLIAQLHWSDYVHGAWGNPRSGNPDHLSQQSLTSDVGLAVNTTSCSISVAKESFTEDGDERGVFVSLGDPFERAFYVQGRNSPPTSAATPETRKSAYSPSDIQATRRMAGNRDTLKVSIDRRVSEIGLEVVTKTDELTLLTPPGPYSLLEPNNEISGPPQAIVGLIRPIFVQDGQYTLFGEPVVTERTVQEWEEWVTVPAPSGDVFYLGEYIDKITIRAARPDLESLVLKGVSKPLWVKPPRFGGEDPDWLLNDVTAIAFNDVVIHPAAGTQLVDLDRSRVIDSGVFGSDLAAGVQLTPRLTDASIPAEARSVGLGVVGGSGASRAILTNITAFQKLGRG